jgi:hypothetical protein
MMLFTPPALSGQTGSLHLGVRRSAKASA